MACIVDRQVFSWLFCSDKNLSFRDTTTASSNFGDVARNARLEPMRPMRELRGLNQGRGSENQGTQPFSSLLMEASAERSGRRVAAMPRHASCRSRTRPGESGAWIRPERGRPRSRAKWSASWISVIAPPSRCPKRLACAAHLRARLRSIGIPSARRRVLASRIHATGSFHLVSAPWKC